MNRKKLIIVGVVLLAIIAGVFWYANKEQSLVRDERGLQKLGQVTEEEIRGIENELWNQLMQDPKETSRDKNNFSISKVNDNKTIALGAYISNGPGGANVFAYRLNLDEEWIVKITQEALLCSDVIKFSEDQVKFIKKNYVDYCAEFDKDGFMHKNDL